MSEIPIVRQLKLKKTLLSGKYEASFECPNCSAKLKAQESEFDSEDTCPE